MLADARRRGTLHRSACSPVRGAPVRGTALDIDFLIATLHHNCVQETGTNEPVKELEHWQSLLELCEGYRVFAANQSLCDLVGHVVACGCLQCVTVCPRGRQILARFLDYAALCTQGSYMQQSHLWRKERCPGPGALLLPKSFWETWQWIAMVSSTKVVSGCIK